MKRAENRPDTVVVGALDEIMGARSRVGVLRFLSTVRHHAWPSDICRAIHYPRSTVWNALQRLDAQGIVEPRPIEVQRQVPWRICPGHPLHEPLLALFQAEREGGLITDPDAEERRERLEFIEGLKADLRARGIPVDDRPGY